MSPVVLSNLHEISQNYYNNNYGSPGIPTSYMSQNDRDSVSDPDSLSVKLKSMMRTSRDRSSLTTNNLTQKTLKDGRRNQLKRRKGLSKYIMETAQRT